MFRMAGMVTSSSLRKLALLPLSLLLLAGCGKVETTPSQAPVASAPVASPAQQSAIPNSFNDVAAQLDSGGDLYVYLNTAQFLGKLSHGVDVLHDLALSGSASMSATDRAQAEKAFAALKDAVHKSGIEDVTGFGASSFAVSPGLYRNKFFAHHDPAKGTGILWSLCGKEPHALNGLDFLPVDTATAGFGDFDLAGLINFLRQETQQSGIPEAQQAVSQWETQFTGVTGLKLDDVLQSLNGSMGMVITLDATSTISIPLGSQAQTIPTPRLAILLAVKNDLIFNQVDKMLSSNPGIIKADEPDLRMRTMPLPFFPGINLRPTVAQWNGFLVIASDEKLIRNMIAVQKGAPGFKSTPEYTALSAGMPTEGNSFGICTQRFADVYLKFENQMFANQPGGNPAQVATMQRIISNYEKVPRNYAVGVRMPNGWLSVAQGSQGSSQLIAPMIVAPVAIAAGVAIPYYSAMHRDFTP